MDEDVLERIAEASAAAFAMDRSDRIIYWNEGAERLTGWKADDVLGRFCFDALAGRDLFGNRYCNAECPMVVAAAGGESSNPFLIDYLTRDGWRRRVRVQTVPLPAPGSSYQALLHLFDEEDSGKTDKLVSYLRAIASSARPAPPDPPISVCPLSPREKQLLMLLANGYSALNIAARLDLSHATVRNHIQRILQKMDVHSQVEAVAIGFRRGWLTAGP